MAITEPPLGLKPPPKKVGTVSATAGIDGVTVDWPAVLGLRYHVERSEDRTGWRRIAWFVHPSFLDTQGLPGQWYRVIGVANDVLGPPSDPVQASYLFIPIGRPLDDGLLLVALASMAQANLFWRENVPASYRGLLTLDGWAFDLRRMSFVSPAGVVLTDAARKALIESFLDSVRHEIQSMTAQMSRGRMLLSEWESRMAGILRQFHAALLAFGVGGLESVSPDDLKAALAGLAFNFDRLARFSKAIADEGDRADTERDVLIRAGLYGDAGYGVMEEARRRAAKRAMDRGRRLFLMERNILDDEAFHCAPAAGSAGCPELSAMGWQPIGTLPAIGTRTCKMRCRCFMQFSSIVS